MPKVNLKGCKDAIMEIAGEALSENEASEFINALERKIENIDQTNIANLEGRIKQAGVELTEDLKKVALINKRNALYAFNAQKNLSKYAKTWSNPFEGILAFLEDSRRGDMESASRGVNAIVEGYKAKYLGELKARLFKAGVIDEFSKDLLSKEIYMEFYEPGSSGSPKAKMIRDIMTALKQDTVEKQNLYGSFIHFLPEHIKRQTYSPLLIKKNFGPERFKKFINLDRFLTPDEYTSTFKAWAEFMLPLLDHEETFKDADKMDFLRGAFDGVMSGRHGPIERASGAEINVSFFKAGSLAKKASTQRLLHFKDGPSAYTAFSQLSDEPISKGFVTELEHAATNIGLMQQLGPNPKGTLEETIKNLEYEYSRSGEEKKFKQLQESKHRLFSALSFIDRSANIPSNPTIQTATASIISLLSQAKLGKLFFFALPDKALINSTLTRNGMRGMDALVSALQIKRPGTSEERLRLMLLGGEIKSFINTVGSRFSTGAEQGLPSTIFNSQKHFFNLTGINWLDDVGTDAIVGALPRHLGAMADKSFENIVPAMRQMFKMFGITEKEWDAWRSTVYSVDKGQNVKPGMSKTLDNWITPDRFSEIPDEHIDSLLKDRNLTISDNNRKRQRDQLENKFRSWLTSQRDEGVLMPGSKEHRLATFGTQSGTALGSLTRLIMMFKTFPITVYTKIMRREMYGNGARTFTDWMKSEKNTNFHATQLIALSTIAGYLSLTIDEYLQGRNPRSFTDHSGNIDTAASLQTLKDSFLRGNALSMFGDLMLRQYDSGTKNILSQLGGPAVNEFIKSSSLMSRGIRGDATSGESMDFLKRNTPWANLFYIKPALDHLVWFNIQEMLDPGSLRDQELKHKDNYNQDYWLAPSDVNKQLHK